MHNEGLVNDQYFIGLTQNVLNAIDSGDYETYNDLCAEDMICFEPESKGNLVHGVYSFC